MTLRTTNGKMKFNCPHCDAKQDDLLEDWVVPGRTGPASRTREKCYNCGKVFVVEYTGNEFTVEKAR